MNIQDIPTEIIQQVGEIRDMTFPTKQGHTSIVAILHTPDKKYIVKKTESPLYNEWLSEEYEALQQLCLLGLPIPKAYSIHIQNQTRWLLMDHIEGITLREFLSKEPVPHDKEKAIVSFARCLKKIHESSCPEALMKNDTDWLDNMLMKADYNLTNFTVDGTEALLKRIQEIRPTPITNTLIHGDFTIDNVLVHNGNIVGVIDWSGAAYGDPRYDVALAIRPKHNAFEDDRDKEVFYNAYGKLRLTDEEYDYFEDGLYNFF
ncbi:phosphotransferase family protein [Paenibacillus tundrae]|uniref:Aminoglycoside phosphotransferase (APT) family kinase protein n=1 Tax=Paenibacillus tundrae TaxID=528187 RepID=A0ABT9WDW2_9BACL|nr:phosphotransferase [Paenibacillus tundrae]MDQ0171453.1 aminoglycoside phosphotransferase (APT) family kinase protein [Paenibacillus tundrae]